jgi:peptidoglycan/LPS O-acetylase OafA/YrhL
MKYRPEIDGLRAVSVLAVIIYHAKLVFLGYSILPGGFLGVDIFFVISGYLITTIIFQDLALGKFSFINFYERRVRRIIPSLYITFAVSIFIGWMTFLPVAFIDFAHSLIASILFSSNMFFMWANQEYAAQSSLLKPLLHTWSLAVEEQFYIFYPILLLFLFKFFKKFIYPILSIFLVASLLLAYVLSDQLQHINYYILPTRAWELLTGAVLAQIQITHGKNKNNFLEKVMPIIGVGLIIYSFCYLNDDMAMPSFYSLFSVLGVAFIIRFGSQQELVSKLLSIKLSVGIGLISYSLYLFHFPIFAWFRLNTQVNLEYIDAFMAIVFTFILAILSYYLVERPFRSKKNFSRNQIFKFSGIATLVLLVVASCISIFEGIPSRLPAVFSNFPTQKPWLMTKQEGKICYDTYFVKQNQKMLMQNAQGDQFLDFCTFNKKSSRSIYLIGDSQLTPLQNPLIEFGKKHGFKFIPMTVGGCFYAQGIDEINYRRKIPTGCAHDIQIAWREKILGDKNAVVIIGGRLPLYLSERFFDNGEGGIEIGGDNGVYNYRVPVGMKMPSYAQRKHHFSNAIVKSAIELAEHGHKVVLIYPIPEVGWDVPQMLKSKISKDIHDISLITTSYDVYKKRSKASFDILNSIQHKNIFRVYPHKLFCDSKLAGRCLTHDQDHVFYYDDDHPSPFGGELISEKIEKLILSKNL